jgi:hypothetical protein
MAEELVQHIDRFDLNPKIRSDSHFSEIFTRLSYLSPDVFMIFDIARYLLSTETDINGDLSELISKNENDPDLDTEIKVKEIDRLKAGDDEQIIDGMQSLSEFPYILKKQFLLPDEIFDRRMIYKELLIKKNQAKEKKFSWTDHLKDQSKLSYEKKLRRQRTYILMDVSGSTSNRHRLLLEKAIIYTFLENNQKNKGEVFFRAFNQGCSELVHAKTEASYLSMINKSILPMEADGQTNLQKALLIAIEDLERISIKQNADLLIVTDGLCSINVQEIITKAPDLKITVVLIGHDNLQLSKQEIDDYFKDSHAIDYKFIERNNFKESAETKRKEFESLHSKEKSKINEEIQSQYHKALKELATLSGGKFIHIDDLPNTLFKFEKIKEHVSSEIERLKAKLSSENFSPLEKERILQELFALQNYLNSIHKNYKLSKEQERLISEDQSRLKNFIENDKDLMELLRNSEIKMAFASKSGQPMKDISLSFLFKILFYKFKVLFLERR